MKSTSQSKIFICIVSFFITIAICSDIPQVEAEGIGSDEKLFESESCFGPNTKLTYVERIKGFKKVLNELAPIEEMYNDGYKAEIRGDSKTAYIKYKLADIAYGQYGFIIYPVIIGQYRVASNSIEREVSETLGPLTTEKVYNYYRKLLMIEKTQNIVNVLKGKKIDEEDKVKLQVLDTFLNFIKELITMEKILIVEKNNGFLFFGSAQIEFLQKALVEYGVILYQGKWEVVDNNKIITDLKEIETRGILKERAIKYSNNSSFVPGLKSLNVFKKVFKSGNDIWQKHIIEENVWEFSIFNDSLDDLKNQTFMEIAKGDVFKQLMKKEDAAIHYYKALSISSLQIVEPLLKLYEINMLQDDSDKEIARTIRAFIEQIDSIRGQLIGLQKKVGSSSLDKVKFNAAINHAYFIRDLVLGRILLSIPSENGSMSIVINMAFISEWIKGMKGYGVILPRNDIYPNKLLEKDWKDPDNIYINSGFWQGCNANKKGDILIPGIQYLNEMLNNGDQK